MFAGAYGFSLWHTYFWLKSGMKFVIDSPPTLMLVVLLVQEVEFFFTKVRALEDVLVLSLIQIYRCM